MLETYATFRSIWVLLFILFLHSNLITGEFYNYNKKSSDDEKTTVRVEREKGISCLHCASPRSVVKSHHMLEAMDQLFLIRNSRYPYRVVDPNCGRRYNLSMITHKQTCKYPYCATLTFNDKEGSPLVVRGCAESFMASSTLEESSKAISCRKLHPSLDISECICRNREICSNLSNNLKLSSIVFTSLLVSIISSLCCNIWS